MKPEISTLLIIRLNTLVKHGDAIVSIFEPMFEPWMNDTDKIDFMASTLQAIGKNFCDLDNDLEAGLQNGHSIKFQVELCRRLLVDWCLNQRAANRLLAQHGDVE